LNRPTAQRQKRIEALVDIKRFLSENDALVDVRAADKQRLLKELCARAGQTLKLDAESISKDILKREELGSTGVGGGVATPHARITDLSQPFGVLARLRRPIDFMAIDGRPVDLVFLLLLPMTTPGEQLNALAAVARKLRDQHVVRELRSAADNSAMYRVLTSMT
jgi:nitrogen PTS system EIIA component